MVTFCHTLLENVYRQYLTAFYTRVFKTVHMATRHAERTIQNSWKLRLQNCVAAIDFSRRLSKFHQIFAGRLACPEMVKVFNPEASTKIQMSHGNFPEISRTHVASSHAWLNNVLVITVCLLCSTLQYKIAIFYVVQMMRVRFNCDNCNIQCRDMLL